MSWKATVVALVVLLGVGAYFLFVAQPEQERKTATEAAKTVLTAFADTDVQSLELERGADKVAAERTGNKAWRITAPVATAGDSTPLDDLARKISRLTARGFVKEAVDDLTPFGLDAPRASITATTKDGQVTTLLLGEVNAFDDSVFARTADQTHVVTVPKEVFAAADKGLMDLREKRLLTFEQKDARKITVELAGREPYVLEQEADVWHLRQPQAELADASTVSSVLSTLRNVRAEAFEVEDVQDLAQYGLASPGLHAQVVLAGREAPLQLWVATAPPDAPDVAQALVQATAGVGQPLARIKGHVLKNLDKSVFDLQDKTLLDFDRDAVRKIKVNVGETFYVVEGQGDPVEWRLVAPHEGAVKKFKISSLLSSLKHLKAKEFAAAAPKDLAPFGLDTPSRQIVLSDAAGEALATLLLGREDGEFWLAKGGRQHRVSRLDKKAVDRWAWTAADVLETPTPAPATP